MYFTADAQLGWSSACLLTTCLPPGPEVRSWRLQELRGNRRLLAFRSAHRRYFFSTLILLSLLSFTGAHDRFGLGSLICLFLQRCDFFMAAKAAISFLHLSVNVWIIKDKSLNSFLIVLKQNILHLKEEPTKINRMMSSFFLQLHLWANQMLPDCKQHVFSLY